MLKPLMRDVHARRGVLVCMDGHSEAAVMREEQAIDIRLLSEIEVLEIDHAAIPVRIVETRSASGRRPLAEAPVCPSNSLENTG
ncbi:MULTISPECIES: hypothetical protein [unclassified Bradyrhizobium]|uniref:hypothetical protein n=1 Tax=unclassified Bradyrhizobium TaxID=2631580 RepID=UPI0028E696C1|nr:MULTISPECIES: hypothetical protein [unclassified Bradyrhizobium]